MHYKQGIEICSPEGINKHVDKNVLIAMLRLDNNV